METHDTDPKANDRIDPWDGVSADFSELGRQLRDTYRKVAEDQGPTDEEIKQAFNTLAGAWDQVAESVSTALKDPVIREQLKDAASSLATALGTTIVELGEELRRTDVNGENTD